MLTFFRPTSIGTAAALALFAAIGAVGAVAGEPAPTSPPRFRSVLPPAAKPDATDVFLRDFALRALAYDGTDTARALAAFEHEPNAAVRRSMLDALVASGNGTGAVAALVRAQCDSPEEATAALAYSLLPTLGVADAAVYQRGFAHSSSVVQVAAVDAAADSAVAALLAPEFEKLLESPTAALRIGAVRGLIAAAKNRPPNAPQPTPQSVASGLLQKNPALARPVVSALLRLGETVPEAFAAQLLALPEEHLLDAIAAYGDSPARLDSDFLRTAALGKNDRVAAGAVALLASRASRKNLATLDCLIAVLNGTDPTRIAALLANFETDGEFGYMLAYNNRTNNETGATNDRFGDIGATPTSLIGEIVPTGGTTPYPAGWHIPRRDIPTFPAIARFLNALEKAQVDKARLLTPALQNRASLLLFLEGLTAPLPNLLNSILESRQAGSAPLAQQVGLARYSEPRLIELVLLAHLTDSAPMRAETLAQFAPFLTRAYAGHSRILASAGRKLAVNTDAGKRVLGLILIAAHGVPTDADTYFVPALREPESRVRRVAAHGLSRLAPELFFLRLSEIAADPSPLVRASVPLAFSRTGFRWEHHVDATARIAQWVPPAAGVHLTEDSFQLLKKLAQDADADIRLDARFALLQHGQLDDATPLLEASTPLNDPLHTARLIQSVAAARAAGHAPPPALAALAQGEPPAAAVRATAPDTLVLLVTPDDIASRRALAGAVEKLRLTHTGIRIVTYYTNDADTDKVRATLFKIFPVPMRQKQAPVLAFSSGAWYADGTAPDYARLCEVAAHNADTDPLLLERVLGLSPHVFAEPEPPESEIPLVLIIALSFAGCCLLGLGIWFYIERRNRRRLYYY